jgi:hypothetical protein
MPRARVLLQHVFFAIVGIASLAVSTSAEPKTGEPTATSPLASPNSSERQAKLEAALSKMLSGATLEGSFTVTGPGSDSAKLSREKYTLGEVKKMGGDVWLFPTRIEYGGKDVTLPIPLPIQWAGDTPVVVVDSVDLPGFGAVSARVMFFSGHYAGFWQHGKHSGNLFGKIHPADEKPAAKDDISPSKSGSEAPAEQKPKQ